MSTVKVTAYKQEPSSVLEAESKLDAAASVQPNIV